MVTTMASPGHDELNWPRGNTMLYYSYEADGWNFDELIVDILFYDCITKSPIEFS